MTGINLPPIEDLDVDDLASLPKEHRYELHEGNLVIMTPSTYWHKVMAQRLLIMLHAAGHMVLQDAGIRGDRPRDLRLPDLGVVISLPPELADYSNLPGSAFGLVIEIVSENSLNGEYTEKARWYAERGIPEYWIVDRDPQRSHGDALVHLHRLTLGGGEPSYVRERSVRLSELEAEFRAKAEA
ncbi:Uma2 family endonuclease [Paractinoplanes hotanensis]|uniref:Uma2 family endonuclease n=1 Tax=Paractinoplanes hotanensis TaxID=2906497 RepID=A0ABT0XZ53_9ACTN|nr:Uma2 family endonuclease [Actinoplanes hotanensis]MCM4079061.1 Uma2 family endonuclease [Actinoplanes hotanensis]